MRRSKRVDSPARKLTALLEQILVATPAEATETIKLRHGYKLGDPETRFGPKVSSQSGCVPCTGTMIVHSAYIVPGYKRGPMFATVIDWPPNHVGLFVLRNPGSFIECILNEHDAIRPEPRAQLTAELIAAFEQQLNKLRA